MVAVCMRVRLKVEIFMIKVLDDLRCFLHLSGVSAVEGATVYCFLYLLGFKVFFIGLHFLGVNPPVRCYCTFHL